MIVGLITADILPYWWTSQDWSSGIQPIGGYSVLNLLVVIAGFFLLVTGAYPRGLFDLLMGINRWCYRVLTYVALMHDEYPPFRLDQGQYERSDEDYADAQRTRLTGRMATAPRMAQTPATEYSTP